MQLTTERIRCKSDAGKILVITGTRYRSSLSQSSNTELNTYSTTKLM
jgi:hypothetical protein